MTAPVTSDESLALSTVTAAEDSGPPSAAVTTPRSDPCALAAWPELAGAVAGVGAVATQAWTVVEYGRQGIRCNCVAPAGVKTPMIGNFRVPEGGDFSLVERIMAFDGELDPTDIANTFLFLASDEADRVNGTCISVDDAMLA